MKVISLHDDKFYKSKAKEYENEAFKQLGEQNYKEAAKLFELASKYDSKNPEYDFYAGVVYYSLENRERSLFYLEAAAKKSKTCYDYLFTFGEALFRYGEYERAEEAFEQALPLRLERTEVLFSYLKTLNILKKSEHAKKIGLLLKAEIKEEDFESEFELGNAFSGCFEFDHAEACFLKCTKMRREKKAHYSLSNLYLMCGKHKQAEEVLFEMFALFPEEEEHIQKKLEVIKQIKNIN